MNVALNELLRARRPLVGTVLSLPGATAAELLAEPFDLVWIDLEHAALGPLDAQEMLVGAQAAGTRALVRLPADAHALMTTMLDAGADGVVLANVDDPAVARAAVARSALPPAGVRGYGPRRLSLRGRSDGRVPAEPSLWVQIETQAGVERAAEIAAVDGVDAVVVGTADLSFAVGTPLDSGSPSAIAAIRTVRAAVEGAAAFGVAGALDSAPPAVRDGASILVHSTDARLCASAVDAAAARLRALMQPDPQEARP